MITVLSFGNNLLKFNNYVIDATSAPEPVFPTDMDFIYQAKDFDGTKIPNKAPNSIFGDYLKYGTLTLHGSGSSAYLTNGFSDYNYLYKDLSSSELDKFKAINTTYTYFVRVVQETNDVGGVISFRNNTGTLYIYMLRTNNKQLQIHTDAGYDCGSDFSLTTDRVYKVIVNGSSFKAINLDNNAEYSLTYSTNRGMGNQMLSFTAYKGSHSEANLSRFYAIAGIPRATTAIEDSLIKQALMNQSA